MRAWVRGRGGGRPHELVRLVTRLAVAQVVAAAAVGLPFSRRQLSSILITLGLAAALCVLTFLVHSGTRAAWLTAVLVESVFFLYGLEKFVVSRYVGGTLFALIITGTLVHPAVARAYGVRWGRTSGQPAARDGRENGLAAGDGLADGAGDALGERTVG